MTWRWSLLEDEAFIPPLAHFYQAWIARHRGDEVRARHLWRQVIATEDEDSDEGSLSTLKAMSLCWLGRPLEAAAMVLEEVNTTGQLRPLDAISLALAWGMQGKNRRGTRQPGLRVRGAVQSSRCSPLEWYDFDTLITDEDVKAALREYFDLETSSGSAGVVRLLTRPAYSLSRSQLPARRTTTRHPCAG